MENSTQQSEIDSLHGARLLSRVLFVGVAAMVAVRTLWLLPVLGIPQMVLRGAGRMALMVMVLGFSGVVVSTLLNLPGTLQRTLVVIVMVLGFSGVLVSTLLNLPDTMRRTLLVLFATALLCSGFVALVGWFAVSGASSFWL